MSLCAGSRSGATDWFLRVLQLNWNPSKRKIGGWQMITWLEFADESLSGPAGDIVPSSMSIIPWQVNHLQAFLPIVTHPVGFSISEVLIVERLAIDPPESPLVFGGRPPVGSNVHTSIKMTWNWTYTVYFWIIILSSQFAFVSFFQSPFFFSLSVIFKFFSLFSRGLYRLWNRFLHGSEWWPGRPQDWVPGTCPCPRPRSFSGRENCSNSRWTRSIPQGMKL